MLVGFIVAVFWVIATVVFIRGYKRWVHGHDQIKQNEAEEDLIDEVLRAITPRSNLALREFAERLDGLSVLGRQCSSS